MLRITKQIIGSWANPKLMSVRLLFVPKDCWEYVHLSKITETLRLCEVKDDPESKGMPFVFLGKEKNCCQGPSFQFGY